MVIALGGDILIIAFYDGNKSDSLFELQTGKAVSKHVERHFKRLIEDIPNY